MIGFVFLLLGTLELGKSVKLKKGRIVFGICTAVMLVVGMGFIVYDANVYTEFRGNQFIADYIEVLQNADVEGTLKHKEKIEVYIQDFDEAPDKEGWNKIQELMR